MTPLTQCRAHLELEALRLLTGIREGENSELIGQHIQMVKDKYGDMQACEFDGRQDDLQRAEKMAGRVC